ncbi:hypothetical protein H112_00998 [Trichophyton rubrum D6]|uniref:Uncharacterized protein n=3 Tax=Trichophyton TaxID=5550 RepID=A0A080WXF0_TRIRC|nr:uncharacterized protein TERG_12545 [Trichophyton rubrum CBS 118892]EZF26947.1 hypothetical protein H100_00998 [Trichophyton rubrum MR850]EZF45987.1 hypothetical protein H102_00989 [Trichophyton rubrum CBS 100081]EZF56638.1 hypothetical protein H103_00998 [Trichophyton rubrum CBS 288.86]EZF67298.1 hypothetical protein H104_00981 [Trichophyton rubrum CBS 289.86]EZF77947.1 hypothetical protein H105_00995 [Trichophyton soudanense CBS 452.61]EZF88598.1 hypothetical protein H110_00998 [Trichophy
MYGAVCQLSANVIELAETTQNYSGARGWLRAREPAHDVTTAALAASTFSSFFTLGTPAPSSTRSWVLLVIGCGIISDTGIRGLGPASFSHHNFVIDGNPKTWNTDYYHPCDVSRAKNSPSLHQ